MLAEKVKIESVLEDMNEHDIKKVWNFIQRNCSVIYKSPAWEDIELDVPAKDEIILLSAINGNDKDFISQEELLSSLDINPSEIC